MTDTPSTTFGQSDSWIPDSVRQWTKMDHRAVREDVGHHQTVCSCGWTGPSFNEHFARELRHRGHDDGDCLGSPDCGWCISEEKARQHEASSHLTAREIDYLLAAVQNHWEVVDGDGKETLESARRKLVEMRDQTALLEQPQPEERR